MLPIALSGNPHPEPYTTAPGHDGVLLYLTLFRQSPTTSAWRVEPGRTHGRRRPWMRMLLSFQRPSSPLERDALERRPNRPRRPGTRCGPTEQYSANWRT